MPYRAEDVSASCTALPVREAGGGHKELIITIIVFIFFSFSVIVNSFSLKPQVLLHWFFVFFFPVLE